MALWSKAIVHEEKENAQSLQRNFLNTLFLDNTGTTQVHAQTRAPMSVSQPDFILPSLLQIQFMIEAVILFCSSLLLSCFPRPVISGEGEQIGLEKILMFC